jgi:hypothetical protein
VPEADLATRAWRGIDELAELIGAYCWVENRIFGLSGAWASGAGHDAAEVLEPALRVWCASVSARHGALASRWAERLPVRAGVDPGALVTAPAGPLARALDLVAAGPAPVGAATLVGAVLPGLLGAYGAHLRTASPVTEAPVLEVLAGALRDLGGEILSGRLLLEESPEGLTRDGALDPVVKQAFEATRVFPAVPPS